VVAPLPPEADPARWFHHLGCRGRHYVLGNPHTVPGRLWAWCPREACSIFVSLADMGTMSAACRHWVAGYLHGCEPEPPRDEDGMPAYGTAAHAAHRRRLAVFHRTGRWPPGRPPKA
jgi:hypothetical protein